MKPTPGDYRRAVLKHHYLLIAGFVAAIAYSIAALAMDGASGGPPGNGPAANGQGGDPKVNEGQPKHDSPERGGCSFCHGR